MPVIWLCVQIKPDLKIGPLFNLFRINFSSQICLPVQLCSERSDAFGGNVTISVCFVRVRSVAMHVFGLNSAQSRDETGKILDMLPAPQGEAVCQ